MIIFTTPNPIFNAGKLYEAITNQKHPKLVRSNRLKDAWFPKQINKLNSKKIMIQNIFIEVIEEDDKNETRTDYNFKTWEDVRDFAEALIVKIAKDKSEKE